MNRPVPRLVRGEGDPGDGPGRRGGCQAVPGELGPGPSPRRAWGPESGLVLDPASGRRAARIFGRVPSTPMREARPSQTVPHAGPFDLGRSI